MTHEDPHARWNRKWRRLYRQRMNSNGFKHQDAQDHADRTMRAQDGKRPPAPPSLFRASLPILWQFAKTGGRMNFDWTKTLWKSVRGALAGAAALAVLSFFGKYDTAPELLAAGVPPWLAGGAVLGVLFLASGVRNFMAIRFPGVNLVKKAGEKLKGK